MDNLSQRELLNEGIGTILKGLGKGVGAVGGALKAASDAGIEAGYGDLYKGAQAGAAKADDLLTSKKEKLLKTLDDQGVMIFPGTDIRGKKKLAVVNIVQYDYNERGDKEPMQGAKQELAKFKFKDGGWEKVAGAREIKDGYSMLTKEEVKEVQEPDQKGPLSGKVVKHLTAKGTPAYGTVIGYTYEEDQVGIQPFKGARAPGIYGKKADQVEESSAEEATNFYSAGIKEGTSQANLLRQLTLLSK
jgi:hypothetical protein